MNDILNISLDSTHWYGIGLKCYILHLGRIMVTNGMRGYISLYISSSQNDKKTRWSHSNSVEMTDFISAYTVCQSYVKSTGRQAGAAAKTREN